MTLSITRDTPETFRGAHLLVDCRGVARETCLNDRLMLDVLCDAARRAGAEVISQMRYRFPPPSPAGFTAICLLNESHCSAHSYADDGLIALDIFTCGPVSPLSVLRAIQRHIDLGTMQVQEMKRFPTLIAEGHKFEPAEFRQQRKIAIANGDESPLADTRWY